MEKINKKTRGIVATRENLVVLFFVASAVVIGLIGKMLTSPGNSEVVGARIFTTLCIFAIAIAIGRFAYWRLGKKLDELVRQKKSLIAQR